MNISPEVRKFLVDEINYAVGKMEKADDPSQKLFYFSAVFGVLQRVFNIEYDPDLVVAHYVIVETHKGFVGRLRASREDPAVPVAVEQIERLTSLTKEFSRKIEGNKDFTEQLKKFIVLTYSTTGNGFYLYDKGVLKI